MHPPFTPRAWFVLLLIAVGCASPEPSTRIKHDMARQCPEATYLDARGVPRSASTRQIRYCFPGEANCFCDRDNDCYALDGYAACSPPVAQDAGADVEVSVSAPTCLEAVYRDAAGTPRSVSTRQIRYCFPGELRCYCDRDNDCYAESGYVACVPPSAPDAGSDAAEVATGVPTCPEAVVRDATGTPRSASTRQIRWCFPGEANCFCDRDNDCYALSGYVACAPPGPADAGADAASDAAADTASDATTGVPVCAEAVYRDAVGTPRSVSTRQIRWCFPGEARCFCDADGDCYSLSGYVACVPPGTPDAGPDVMVDRAAGTCPEAIYRDPAGTPRSVSTRQIRYCFPGELRCYCDRDNDCYAESGYVACVPPGTADAGADVAAMDAAPDVATIDAAPDVATMDASPDVTTMDAAPDVAPTDGALARDPVVYTGGFTGLSGLSLNRLTVGGAVRSVWVYAPTDRGARPPLLITLHDDDATGDTMLGASGAIRVGDLRGVVLVAPDARAMAATDADYDHPAGRQRYWDTTRTSPDLNADLLLLRASIVEAQDRYNTDPDRVYVLGHGNGGFFALLTSVALAERVAGFAENGAGLVTCASRPACAFTGTALTCAGLAAEPGWCDCTAAGLPIVPSVGRAPPGYLAHGVEDRRVSPRYTCALAARLQSIGVAGVTALRPGGHSLPAHFATDAWSFLAPLRRR
jgi:predicted esterase/uncharacterized cupin superfamily protein